MQLGLAKQLSFILYTPKSFFGFALKPGADDAIFVVRFISDIIKFLRYYRIQINTSCTPGLKTKLFSNHV